jgi:acyl carrier protein
MNTGEIFIQIETIVNEMLQEKGLEPVRLSPTSRFLGDEIPIDSLDLAVLVTRLEQVTKNDPFKSGFREFRTVADLAALYAE